MDDPLAKDLNDISDVEKQLPGYVSGIREWFRWYKTPDDKPLNGFGFEEKALDKVRRRNLVSFCCSLHDGHESLEVEGGGVGVVLSRSPFFFVFGSAPIR